MKRANFRYVPHTADVAFVAYGDTFGKALESAALAILNTMFDLKKLRSVKAKQKTARVHDTAESYQDAAWFILQDIVSKVDQMGIQAFKFKVNSVSESGGKVKVRGCIFYKPTKEYASLLEVKAVPPYGLKVDRVGKRYRIKAVLDV